MDRHFLIRLLHQPLQGIEQRRLFGVYMGGVVKKRNPVHLKRTLCIVLRFLHLRKLLDHLLVTLL